MATTREILKTYFRTKLKPTQAQFWAWLDSYWHVNDSIPIASIETLSEALDNIESAAAKAKATADAVAGKLVRESKPITLSNLDAVYQYAYNHGKKTKNVSAKLYDNEGVEQITAGLFCIVDEDDITLAFNNPIEGEWTLLLDFWI
jgi:hypothetical protein